MKRAFLDPETEARLRSAVVMGSNLAVGLTLDDMDELHGCIAAEANHASDANVRRALDAVCDRLGDIERRYTDNAPAPESASSPSGQRMTAKQGQYVAFIYWFRKIHGKAPAEAELQRFFKVSAPAVHAMVLSLEKRGLINRTPGQARSITLRVPRAGVPELE